MITAEEPTPDASDRMPRGIQIRHVSPTDDLEQITRLIHLAYAQHAAIGLRFWGTHQSVIDTATRFASGQGFVAILDGEYVGTITVRPPQPESTLDLYRDPHTWSICQFAVSPTLKGAGLGKALHRVALAHARQNGGQVMAIDTAAPAERLIAMYRAWGYRPVGEHSWRPHTNYDSVVMSRPLGSPAHDEPFSVG
jgi:ribosomal protein S18 acetylase RimI-like enzyme